MFGQNSYLPYSYANSGYGMPVYGQRPYMQPQQQQMANPQQQTPQQQGQPMQQQQQVPVSPIPQVPMQPSGGMQPQGMSFVYETPIQAVRFATEEEAKAYIVYPNATALFIDEGKGKIYLKTANASGVSSIQYYDKQKEGADQAKQDSMQKEGDNTMDWGQFVKKEQLNGFVTWEKYNDLLKNYQFLEEQLRIMQNQIKSKIIGVGEQKHTRTQMPPAIQQ